MHSVWLPAYPTSPPHVGFGGSGCTAPFRIFSSSFWVRGVLGAGGTRYVNNFVISSSGPVAWPHPPRCPSRLTLAPLPRPTPCQSQGGIIRPFAAFFEHKNQSSVSQPQASNPSFCCRAANFAGSVKMVENRACPNLDAMSVPEALVYSILHHFAQRSRIKHP